MGNSNTQIDKDNFNTDTKNKFKDIEEAIQKAIDTETIKRIDLSENHYKTATNKK